MIRFIVFFSLLAWSFAAPAGGAPERSPLSEFLGPLRGSLRGESVDPDDAWDSARLFARFGETSAAYGVLNARSRARAAGIEPELFEARLLTEMGLYERADSVLALRPNVWDTRERVIHYLWRSRLQVACGRYEDALGFLGRIAQLPDTLFDAYEDLVACEALLARGDTLEAVERVERRLASGAPPALAIEFETRLLDAYVKSGWTARALEFLEMLKDKAPRQDSRAGLFAREVEVRLLRKDMRGAAGAALELVKTYGTSSIAGAVDSVLARVPVDSLTTEALIEFAGFFIRRSRVADAERLVTALSSRVVDETQREQRRLLYAEILYREKRFTAAGSEVRAPFADPASERKAKLLRARVYRGTGERERAAEAYETFAKAYPYDSKAPEALYVAWDMQHEAGRTAKAAELLATIVETYPSHKYARLATLRIVEDHVERREYTRGARLLEQALERRDRNDPAFLYYLAGVYGRMGNAERRQKLIDELMTLDPVSFYLDPEIPSPFGLPGPFTAEGEDSARSRALLEFLGAVVARREQAYENVRGLLGPTDGGVEIDGPIDCLARGRAFVEMGLRDWAEGELREAEAVAGRMARANLTLAVLYDDAAMPWRSIRAAQRVYYSLGKSERRRAESEFRVLTYPLSYPSLVLESCRRAGVAPHLIYAMIREESRFDDKAVSPAGAMGLMQIMPATGEELAEELGLADEARGRLLAPDVNVTLGVWHAARLLERWDGDALAMLAAYNAGSGNAARWFNDRSAGKPRAEQVDGIGFWETREYVKRIVESARLYYAFFFSP